ncbi:MAG TPA: hypothetical protein VN894_18020, partial [Polyangiaceae bacterium]|nr:hypothetical protein [Polyangiaceae bacterium]
MAWARIRVSSTPCLVWLMVFAPGCAPPQGKSHVSAAAPNPADQALRAAVGAEPFAEPDSVGPSHFRVLGPFPNRLAPNNKGRPGLDTDYLGAIGGEAQARLEPTTTVTLGGRAVTVFDATLDSASTLDFTRLFGTDTDAKTAYAYAEG